MKVRSCLTKLIYFYDQLTYQLDEENTVNIVFVDFRKAFDTVSHSILPENLAAHGLDRFCFLCISWICSFLSIFYCIKIANFRHTFFTYMKVKIDRIVPWLFLGSVLLSLVISILFYDIK
ncbi:PREDICTED: taste receptor type 2 member 119-like, partial [Apaloderma vittatum]|uniref:taste receptor type 2 member 119-like n=1 Tax=Apaloderma vittatum TaxID=57397 RepID=UPI0005212D35